LRGAAEITKALEKAKLAIDVVVKTDADGRVTAVTAEQGADAGEITEGL
jgi:hypothetical protein